MELIPVIDYSLECLSGFSLGSFLLLKHLVYNLAVLLIFSDFPDALNYYEWGAIISAITVITVITATVGWR